MVRKISYVKAAMGVVKDLIEAPFLIRQARQRYMGIKQYHPEMVKEFNTLFDFDLPLQRPYFFPKSEHEKGAVYYGPRQKDFASIKYPLEDDTYTLCHEEAHRYHWHVNPFLRKNLNGVLEDLIEESVALYSCVRVLPKLGFNKIAEAIQKWAKNAYIEDYSSPWKGPGLDDVVKLLLERDNEFFREFVRSKPQGLLGKLYPGWEALKLNAYTIPSIGKYLK